MAQQSYPKLSTGIIAQALSSEDGIVLTDVILQVLSIKVVVPKDPANKENKNFRGSISDGLDTTMALFASDCYNFFAEEFVDRKFSICRFSQAQIKSISNNKKIWIMAGLNFLAQPPFKIEISPEQVMDDNLIISSKPVQSTSKLSDIQPSNHNLASNFNVPVPQDFDPLDDSNVSNKPKDLNETEENIISINSINPFQKKWKIKGTISSKSQIKTFNNAKGGGKLFYVHFLDQSGEIKATGFNDQLDKFYPMLELNKTYYISGLKVTSTNKLYTSLTHDFELAFTANSEIQECLEPQSSKILYNFIKVKEIESQEANSRIDLIAVCKDNYGLNIFVSPKTNKEFQKRDLILVDTSMYAVRLTLWGQEAVDFDHPIGSVIQGRSFRVSEFQGKTLSANSDTAYIVNPEAYELKLWWRNVGQNSQFSPLSGSGTGLSEPAGNWPLHNLGEIVNRPAPEKDMIEKFSCRAFVTFFRDNATYPACPADKCNKKLTNSGSDWYCAKCDRSYPEPIYRYILNACLTDAHTSIWISSFNDEAEVLLSEPANEYARVQDDKYQLDNITYSATYKPYLFHCVAKSEFYNDVQRTNYLVRKIIDEDALTIAKRKIEEIKSFL